MAWKAQLPHSRDYNTQDHSQDPGISHFSTSPGATATYVCDSVWERLACTSSDLLKPRGLVLGLFLKHPWRYEQVKLPFWFRVLRSKFHVKISPMPVFYSHPAFTSLDVQRQNQNKTKVFTLLSTRLLCEKYLLILKISLAALFSLWLRGHLGICSSFRALLHRNCVWSCNIATPQTNKIRISSSVSGQRDLYINSNVQPGLSTTAWTEQIYQTLYS